MNMKCEICRTNEAKYVCISCKKHVCASCFRPLLGLCVDCSPMVPLKVDSMERLKGELRKCITFGDFVLTGGKRSSYYVNIKNLITNPEILGLIGRELSWRITECTKIAGVEPGAVPLLVAATSLHSGKPCIIIRKGSTERGVKAEEEYIGTINRGEKFCVIEDVTTTGASASSAYKIIRRNGGMVGRVVTVIDREEGAKDLFESGGVELVSLFRISELVRASELK